MGVFATTWALLLGFAFFGGIYGKQLGDDPREDAAFVRRFPTLAALSRGEASILARLARSEPSRPDDIRRFPLLPALGRLGLALGHSAELWLVVLGGLVCGGAYVAAYLVFLDLATVRVARAALGFLVAFPFAFHLHDGGSLAALTFFTAMGTLLAMRGASMAASFVVALGTLAHPAVPCVAIALVAHGPLAPERRGSRLVAWSLALLPLAVMAVWIGYATTLRREPLPLTALVSPLTAPSGPVVAACLPFALVVFGGIALAFVDGQRVLGLVATAQVLLLLATDGFAGTRALGACWIAFLPLATRLVRWPAAQGLAMAALAIFQGLFFYLFIHRFPFT